MAFETPKNRWLLVLIVAVAVTLLIETAEGRSQSYQNISFAEFSRWLEEKDFLLINVHVPYQGEIPGTDQLLPYYLVEAQKDRLPAAKDTKIVIYCLTGPMGHTAARSLVRLGYTRVYHYAGGMLDWVRNGRQLNDRGNQ